MKRYFKARVVHDPVYLSYSVEIKRHWYSLWDTVDNIGYVESSSICYPHPLIEEAYKRAKKKADSYIQAQIVYEGGS